MAWCATRTRLENGSHFPWLSAPTSKLNPSTGIWTLFIWTYLRSRFTIWNFLAEGLIDQSKDHTGPLLLKYRYEDCSQSPRIWEYEDVPRSEDAETQCAPLDERLNELKVAEIMVLVTSWVFESAGISSDGVGCEVESVGAICVFEGIGMLWWGLCALMACNRWGLPGSLRGYYPQINPLNIFWQNPWALTVVSKVTSMCHHHSNAAPLVKKWTGWMATKPDCR